VKPELSTGYLVGINEFSINNGILDLLEEYNFEKESLLQALKDNKHNHATTSYYLLLKKSEQTKGKADTGFMIKTENQKRDLNNSVQYHSKIEDLKSTINSVKNRANVFSVSDRDTSNTTENNSKYLGTAVNFNQLEKEK